MTVTASVSGYSLINGCQDSANWTGESPANVTDFFKYNSQCIGFTMKDAGTNDTYISGSWNLSGKHLHLWWMTTALKELSSMQVFLYDGSNTGYYNIVTSSTYPGGWYNVVLDCDRSPDSGSQPTLTAITRIGIRVTLSASAKNVQNTWVDHIYVGDGIIAYGDDAGGSFNFDDILAIDENTTYGWGMLRKIGGVYYLVGSLTLGDSVGTNSCDFADSSKDVVYEDRPVDAALYAFDVVGNGTGTTSVVLGSSSGGRGISGCFFHTESTAQTGKFSVTCTDTDVGTYKLYGCTFLDASTVSLPLTGASREVLSCNFEACGPIVSSTCKVRYCTVVSADDVGIQISSPSHQVSDCNLIQCGHGVEFTVAGDYSLGNVVFGE